MADDRPARSRAGNATNDAIRKSVEAAGALVAAGYKPGAFVLNRASPSGDELRAAVRQLLGPPKTPLPNLSALNQPRRLPSTPLLEVSRRPQGAWESGKAALRGVSDSLPMGLGNRLPAAFYALGNAAHLRDPIAAYDDRLEAEEAQDRYDEEVHPTARAVGKWAGTAAQFAALPAEGLLVKGGARLAEATPLMARELAVVGGAGGGISAGSRAASDYLRGKRSSASEYFGDVAGGATDALLSCFGYGGAAGAAGGATAAATTDLLSGRAPSLEHMRHDAVAGADFGLLAGAAGRSWSNALRPMQKGRLGERLSLARTLVGGDLPRFGPKRAVNIRGRTTIPDHDTLRKMLVEAKFGPSARLSRNQRVAHDALGRDGYRIDSFLPRDVGAIAAFPAAIIGVQFGGR